MWYGQIQSCDGKNTIFFVDMWMYRKKERWGEKRTEMVEVLLLVIYIWTANRWVWVFFIYHKMKLSLVFSFPVEMRWFLVFYISSWDEVILPLGCAFLPFCSICRCGLLERKIICEREGKRNDWISSMLCLNCVGAGSCYLFATFVDVDMWTSHFQLIGQQIKCYI